MWRPCSLSQSWALVGGRQNWGLEGRVDGQSLSGVQCLARPDLGCVTPTVLLELRNSTSQGPTGYIIRTCP